MESRLMSWPFLVALGLSWLLAVWLALFPASAQNSWLRLIRADTLVQSGIALRTIGVLWVVLWALVFWFNSRPYAGR
jgi:hypothetical protein